MLLNSVDSIPHLSTMYRQLLNKGTLVTDSMSNFIRGAFCALCLLISIGCGAKPGTDPASTSEDSLSGAIRIDGSSTVYPISSAAAEIFGDDHPAMRISVSLSGTSAGMGKFLLGEIDICDASRPIKDKERDEAKEKGLEFVEFVVGQDGLAVTANPENDWCDSMTVEQLQTIWQPEATETVMKWSDVNPEWPEEEFKLYGPGTASGTFEYFTGAIVGKKNSSRSDYEKNEDDNILVKGVSSSKGGLGYFGYAYYAENKDKLKLIAVDGGDGPVLPSEETIIDGSYKPLSRPLFIYVSKASLQRPEVAAFVKYYVENSAELAKEAQYVAASEETHANNLELLKIALE